MDDDDDDDDDYNDDDDDDDDNDDDVDDDDDEHISNRHALDANEIQLKLVNAICMQHKVSY